MDIHLCETALSMQIVLRNTNLNNTNKKYNYINYKIEILYYEYEYIRACTEYRQYGI